LLSAKDIAGEVRAVLHRTGSPLSAEQILHGIPSGELLKLQGGKGTRGYFSAVGVVRDALEKHLRAEVSFVEVDVEGVLGALRVATSRRTRRLVAVYRL
jgi:hypothetical protein